MSVAPNLKKGQEFKKPPKLVTHTCANGYEFEYYEVDGYSEDDYEDMQNAVCNDPDNQSIDPA